MYEFNFRLEKSLEERFKESERIMKENPDRIPVICELGPQSKFPGIHKTKFLVPRDMTVNQFHFILKRMINIDETRAMYLMADNNKSYKMLLLNKTMEECYNSYHDKKDNFLYIYYLSEIVNGSNL